MNTKTLTLCGYENQTHNPHSAHSATFILGCVILVPFLFISTMPRHSQPDPSPDIDLTADIQALIATMTAHTSGGSNHSPAVRLNLKSDPFFTLPSEDARAWLEIFKSWVSLNKMPPENIPHLMRLILRDPALTWFDAQSDVIKSDPAALQTAFVNYFANSSSSWVLEQQLYDRKMAAGELLETYL